jgi:hypothetical protein
MNLEYRLYFLGTGGVGGSASAHHLLGKSQIRSHNLWRRRERIQVSQQSNAHKSGIFFHSTRAQVWAALTCGRRTRSPSLSAASFMEFEGDG